MKKIWAFLTAVILVFSAAGLAEDEEDLAIEEIVEDVILGEDGEEVLDIPVDDEDSLMDRLSLKIAIKLLDKTEQEIVKLRFFEGRTQCETAVKLGISQVQVSRKEKVILSKLRNNLEY